MAFVDLQRGVLEAFVDAAHITPVTFIPGLETDNEQRRARWRAYSANRRAANRALRRAAAPKA